MLPVCLVFQSTLPVWGATSLYFLISNFRSISIHAPRVGSDESGQLSVYKYFYISIHAPRVGSDRNIFYYSEPKTISCELRSQHDQLSGHLRTEYTRLFSQNRCEPATFP